ncbi:hypothetical protein JOF56_003759 [Kibdelosporangium banguiense]|uniref:Uncharacterized protein n=1 Tax=Kibdelosporangium banguiense TaxID=1365924 RepID=A0ABS4TG74_9PSEU|nr:hypothetical protein [Kibdelosporangium banguiense]MBP2323374.1 hypothetical protein [Kibdelosporangium banguiense]
MKQLERLVVHVEEAIRFGTAQDEPHLRLGLMMIDSAAELMMYRETDYLLRWGAEYGEWLKRAEESLARGFGDQKHVDELRGKVFSKTQRKKIEREFNAKCDLLVRENILDVAQARVLKKLHEYRNETYHRDELRPATLASATRIYIYLVCTMMTTMPVHSMSYSSPIPPDTLKKYLEPEETGLGAGMDMQALIGRKLLAVSGIDNQMEIGEALAEHVTYRLDEIEAMVEECASVFNDMNNRGWDFLSVLGMIQAPEPDDPFDHVRRTVEDYRNWARPVNKAQFRAWRTAAATLATETDDLMAFAAFADLEDAFEPIEQRVMKLGLDVDRAIQHEIDVARGK